MYRGNGASSLLFRGENEMKSSLHNHGARHNLKTDQVTSLVQAAGLLKGARFFSCDHSFGNRLQTREMIVIKFAEFGKDFAHIVFTFCDDGEVELAASSNRHSDYQMQPIVTGKFQGETVDLADRVGESLELIRATIDLYATSAPMSDYERLLELWSPLDPVLQDKD
jgi:hypothetical protein